MYPVGRIEQLTSDFNRLFPGFTWQYSYDSTDVNSEIKDDKVFVYFAVPGFKKEDLKIDFVDNYLKVSGKRSNKINSERPWEYELKENIKITKKVKDDEIDAKLEDGILTVILPLDIKAKKDILIK